MHPTREELSQLANGLIDETTAEQLSSHVEECPQCEETLQGLETAIEDQMVVALRHPVLASAEESEAECQRLLEAVGELGQSFSAGAGTNAAAVPEELQTVRDYELLELIGRGGMGAVYKALHTRLDRVVALKLLPSDRLQDPQAVLRFEREMKAVGKLNHRHIVRATDAGDADGQHYLVMELVDGLDLADVSRRVGPVDIATACELVRQAAGGLQHAHEHGLVHRDIKPSNLMLNCDGTVKILDMGLALLAGPQQELPDELTSTGQFMGTIDYMAPEQGGDSHAVDIRADIYSLGATLYRLLTGQPPFGDDKYDTPMKKVTALATVVPEPLIVHRSDIPVELSELVARLLSKDPADRLAEPAELATALKAFTQAADVALLFQRAIASKEDDAARSHVLADGDTHSEHSTNDQLALSFGAGVGGVQPEASTFIPSAEPQPHHASAGGFADGRESMDASRRAGVLVVLLSVAVVTALFFSGVFKFRTEHGTITIRIPEGEKVDVFIDNDKADINYERNGREVTVTVSEGDHDLLVRTTDGVELRTEERFSFPLASGKQFLVAEYTDGNRHGSESDIANNPDRRAAEWSIQHGGNVGWLSEKLGRKGQSTTLAELPTEDFRITSLWLGRDTGGDIPDQISNYSPLANLGKLREANFGGRESFDDRALAILAAGSPNLDSLDLIYTGVTPAGLAGVELSHLKYLSLPSRAATDLTFKHLAETTNLEHLTFHANGIGLLSDAGMTHIATMKSLTTLELLFLKDHVSAEGLKSLQSLPQLERLDIHTCSIPSAVPALVSENGSVRDLRLVRVNFSSEDFQGLVACRHLENLDLGECHVGDDSVPFLAQMTHLRRIGLWKNSVTPSGIAKLKMALPGCEITSDITEEEIAAATEGQNTTDRLFPTSLVAHPAELPGVKSWSIETWEPRGGMCYFEFHPKKAELVVWSPWEGILRIYTVPSGDLLRIIPVQPTAVYAARMSVCPNGEVLAVIDDDGVIRVIEYATGKTVRKIGLPPVEGKPAYVNGFCWSGDGTKIAVHANTFDKHRVGIIDVNRGRTIRQKDFPHRLYGNGSPMQFSQDGTRLLKSGVDAVVLDVDSLSPVLTITAEEPIRFARWSPDEKQIAVVRDNKWVAIHDAGSGDLIVEEEGPDYQRRSFNIEWMSDGASLLQVINGGFRFIDRGLNPEFSVSPYEWGADDRNHFSLSASEEYCAIPVADRIAVLRTDNGEEQFLIHQQSTRYTGSNMEVSPDRKRFALSCPSYVTPELTVFDGATGDLLRRVDDRPRLSNFTWAPDSQYLIFSSNGGPQINVEKIAATSDLPRQQLILWESEASGNHALIHELKWTADSSRIVTLSEDRWLRVFDAESGKLIAEKNYSGEAAPLKFDLSPDGQRLILSHGHDGLMDVVDVSTLRVLEQIPEAAHPHRKISFNRDGTLIGTNRGTIRDGQFILDLSGAGAHFTHCFASCSDLRCDVIRRDGSTVLEMRDGRALLYSADAPELENCRYINWALNDNYLVAEARPGQVAVYESATGRYVRSTVLTASGPAFSVTADGHINEPGGLNDHIRYVLRTDDDRIQTLTPAEFRARFHWTNDPAGVVLSLNK